MEKNNIYRVWQNRGGYRLARLKSKGHKWIKLKEVGTGKNFKLKANQTNLIKEVVTCK